MRKELEIKVRGEHILDVMPLCKITSGLIIGKEYRFLIFNVKEMSDTMKDKYDRIVKILEEN